jgi:hypothetical protein
MQYNTTTLSHTIRRALPSRLHLLATLCLLSVAILAGPFETSGGWVSWPPVVYANPTVSRRSQRDAPGSAVCLTAAWAFLHRRWQVPVLRSLILATLWLASGRRGPWWITLWPWAVWAWEGIGILLPRVAYQPEWLLIRRMGRWGERLLLWGYLAAALGGRRDALPSSARPLLGRSDQASSRSMWLLCAGPCVSVRHEVEEGRYTASLEGPFTLSVADDDPFRLRLLILFLRLLEVPEEQRGSRRTRDGRTPFVRQQYLAKTLQLPQPDLSRWEGYWLSGDWRRLLSHKTPQVLTLELQERIIQTWARWPAWRVEQLHPLLLAHGVAVTQSQIRQAAHDSGWQIVRQVLGALCVQRVEELRLRQDWLVGDLLAQVQSLLQKVETQEGLTPEEHLNLDAWQAAASEAGLEARPAGAGQPWLRSVQQLLLAPSCETPAEGVCCPECGSSHVGRKGLKPRLKKFLDEAGQVQEVAVYRYRCHNRACPCQSFTAFPPGLVPYSLHRLQVHLLALQMYAWGHSTYRYTGQALGVTATTAYRWVSAFGQELLPVAALFGMVRSSGVVGIDEKWVQVPKNDKPAGDRRKWMYVYLAVDVYTYDLLHIAIYPDNTTQSAHVFLLALRAKGYHPRVVVTDLRQAYAQVIPQVFPQACHHECLFHALQALQRQLAQLYDRNALRDDPRLVTLRQSLIDPLQARTKRTAQRRYGHLMAQRQAWVAEKPELERVFASLEAHWPKLINGIESQCIPRTNNATELVIRRFDQHYQNFCGFDSLQSAQAYLAVFEKAYRFTPFSQDAQPRIRGQSPLQLAGYPVHNLPMTAACCGWALAPPTSLPPEGVPNA